MKDLKEQPDYEGNPEHLAILINALEKCDISLWNIWRQENPETVPDLSGVNLSNIDILEGFNMCGAVLPYAMFNRSKLESADFSKANCEGVDFGDAVLSKVNFFHAKIKSCNFIMADLSKANLENANLCYSTLMHTNLTGSNLTGITCWENNLVNCAITGMVCTHIFIGEQESQRFPEDRDFQPEELEKLFTEHQFITEEIKQIFEN